MEQFAWSDSAIQAAQKMVRKRKIIFGLGFLLFVLAWTNPQWGAKKTYVENNSSDIYLALDLSASMLAQDIKPSRLLRAKKVGEQIIRKLKSERIGLIYFAGDAFIQMPLTTDYTSALAFLRNSSINQIANQGTALKEAIDLGAKKLDEDDGRQRLLIILSDGEDHEGGAQEAAELALNEGTVVFTIGFGTRKGDYIPIEKDGNRNLLTDDKGNSILTKFNPEDLQAIAQAGGGSYFEGNHSIDFLDAIESRVEQLEKKKYNKIEFTAKESYFQWFLLPAIILILFSLLWKENKKQAS